MIETPTRCQIRSQVTASLCYQTKRFKRMCNLLQALENISSCHCWIGCRASMSTQRRTVIGAITWRNSRSACCAALACSRSIEKSILNTMPIQSFVRILKSLFKQRKRRHSSKSSNAPPPNTCWPGSPIPTSCAPLQASQCFEQH